MHSESGEKLGGRTMRWIVGIILAVLLLSAILSDDRDSGIGEASTAKQPAQIDVQTLNRPGPACADQPYTIGISPGSVSKEYSIKTNLPDDAKLSFELTLSGQPEGMAPIGGSSYHSTRSFVVKEGSALLYLEGSAPSIAWRQRVLPNGNYTLTVSFSPYGVNSELSEKCSIPEIFATESVEISNSAVDSEEVVKHMIALGKFHDAWDEMHSDDWDLAAWESIFGTLEKLDYTGGLNPRAFEVYYIPDAHVSLLVNVSKKKITTYRYGKDTT